MFIDLNCSLRWAMWPMGLLSWRHDRVQVKGLKFLQASTCRRRNKTVTSDLIYVNYWFLCHKIICKNVASNDCMFQVTDSDQCLRWYGTPRNIYKDERTKSDFNHHFKIFKISNIYQKIDIWNLTKEIKNITHVWFESVIHRLLA